MARMTKLEQLRLATIQFYPEIAPGLHGHIAELWPDGRHAFMVKTVAAVQPGMGNFSAWVNGLAADETWIMWNVVSPIARKKLLRAGFEPTTFAGSDKSLIRNAVVV